MKKIKQNIFKKVIPIFLVFIAIFTFILPNYAYAGMEDLLEGLGGILLPPIKKLVCGLGDSVMEKLQNTFVAKDTPIAGPQGYNFKYTPGNIFKGEIRALDVNFFDPAEAGTIYEYQFQKNAFPKLDEIPRGEGELYIEGTQYTGGDTFGHYVTTNEWLINDWLSALGNHYGAGDYDQIVLYDDVRPVDIFFKTVADKTYLHVSWRTDLENEYSIKIKWISGWNDATDDVYYDRFNKYRVNLGIYHNGAKYNHNFDGSDNWNDVVNFLRENCYLPENIKIYCEGQYNELTVQIKWYVTEESGSSATMPITAKFGRIDRNNESLYNQNGGDSEEHNVTWGAQGCFAWFSASDNIWEIKPGSGETVESSAATLAPIISKWYKALRLISIVGLMTVLVYISIRMIISSTAKETAKYKKMFLDWLIAMCLIFILHYIMVFLMQMNEYITDFFSFKQFDLTGGDTLFNNIRAIADNSGNSLEMIAHTIMYVALVVLTITFTIQYIKRLIYMAFLTMIAPLICLTYPLDKVKDGQAQAFSMWLKEYIFNLLLQPVHLVLYTVLLDSAVELVNYNPVYAVIAIGFLTPAEKFMRKMFGFEKASTVSQLGAAASGAVVMNGINKLKGMGHKGGAKGGKDGNVESDKPVRTPTNPASLAPLQNASSSPVANSNAPETNSRSDATVGGIDSTQTVRREHSTNRREVQENGNDNNTGISTASVSNNASGVHGIHAPQQKKRTKIGGFINGVGTRYKLWGKGSLKQWGKRGKKLTGVAGGVLGGLTAGMIGMGAGVATGDASKVFQYGVAGTVAGYAAGKTLGNVSGNILEEGANVINAGREGMDPEAYQNRQADKKFRQSKDYAALERKYGSKEMREHSQEFLNAGITDISKMQKALDAGMSSADALAYIKMAKDCPASILHDRTKLKAFLRDNGIPTDNVDELYKNIKKFS